MHQLVFAILVVACAATPGGAKSHERPNVIIFLADDMGYGDLQTYGHPTQEKTFMDSMAENGLKFTQWYSAATLCTPSRAALLTGRQPIRSGIAGDQNVFLPCLNTGLPRSEVTIAEALKDAGYFTGMVGKWHLGMNKETRTDGFHLPQHHGFDFVGTILPFTLQDYCDTQKVHRQKPLCSMCFLYYDTTLIEQPIQLEKLTPRLVHDAQAFLYNQTEDKPFFLYVSFPQTHTPMFNMPQFQNVSRRGAYGDQLLEISWAMKEIFSTLQNLKLDQNTLSIFLSDQGPHLEICDLGGSAGPFRGGKCSFREGALRVPAMANWPRVITKPRVSDEVISSMDVLPTLLKLAGAMPPQDRMMDGVSFKDILLNKPRASHERKLIYFMCHNLLMAVRYKDYKIYYRKQPELSERQLSLLCKDGFGVNYFSAGEDCTEAELMDQPIAYNVVNDRGENVELPVELTNMIVKEIQDDILKYLSTFEEPQKLVSKKYCVPSLVPCCNPPYCVCMDGSMPKCY